MKRACFYPCQDNRKKSEDARQQSMVEAIPGGTEGLDQGQIVEKEAGVPFKEKRRDSSSKRRHKWAAKKGGSLAPIPLFRPDKNWRRGGGEDGVVKGGLHFRKR